MKLRIACLGLMLILLWYLLIVPSLEVSRKPSFATNRELSELAKFDLEKKVYPEIQARLTETNEWLFRKFTLAGGLLAGFFLHLWVPSRRKGAHKIASAKSNQEVSAEIASILKSNLTCAVLGLASIISLFIDIHIRRSVISMQHLGTWAAEYAAVAMGGDPKSFATWEQFIRMHCGNGGMHRSLIDAVQTGNLCVVTLVVFALYQWVFQEVCIRGVDNLNRIISLLNVAVLFMLFLGAHISSGNVAFVSYGYFSVFSNWVYYFAGWFCLSAIIVVSPYAARVGKFQ